jgi:hypothetical protein
LRKGLITAVGLCWLALVVTVAADTEQKLLGDAGDGSRAVAVHHIRLIDHEGQGISGDDEPLLPFSTRQSCDQCHNYNKISAGWHFNAADANVVPGRAGQPWIFVDTGTGTQIGLSYRNWPGTFRPSQFGITDWQFIKLFGRQMPGGGVGELQRLKQPKEIIRGFVSGKLETNCLSCHSADPAYDQSEYALQIRRENFRWAVTAACGFASVGGSAEEMSDTYDYLMPEPSNPDVPTVVYHENTFDHKSRVFFDIVRKVPSKRCYFCHSNKIIDEAGTENWTTDEDVHLAAGLSCVEGESNEAVGWTCESCHATGRLGAPAPEHVGIPPVHFDRLSCTACHSGPWPEPKTHRVKTSRAHALGTHNAKKADDALPHIETVVFAEKPDGKIGPHNLIWPAYWAGMKGQIVTPIELGIVKRTAGKILTANKTRAAGWQKFDAQKSKKVLTSLSSVKAIDGKAVYIAGGKLYSLDKKGEVTAVEHTAAKPYLWPIAHDVRPAAQALGAGRCEDCHSTKAAFFFGQVAVDGPVHAENSDSEYKEMLEFQQLPALYTRAFAMSFVFRPWMKVVAGGSCAIIAAVLLLYALKALGFITKILVNKD